MAETIFTNQQINRFGLNVLGDYAYMLVQAIISDHLERISRARDFAARFDALYDRAAQDIPPEDRMHINRECIVLEQEFRDFVLDLLKIVLSDGFEVFFKPAVLNNIIDLAEYQIHLLNTYLSGREPTFEPIERELFWLPVFSTQCRYIADNVGYYERARRIAAIDFADAFTEKYSFTAELKGLMRTGISDFHIARAHHLDMGKLLANYAEFLVSVIFGKSKNEIPGTLSLLFLDSSYRQLCLFTTELAVFNKTPKPACDPFARRYTIL